MKMTALNAFAVLLLLAMVCATAGRPATAGKSATADRPSTPNRTGAEAATRDKSGAAGATLTSVPSDYPITVHVSAAKWRQNPNWSVQLLEVTINGKKYELSGEIGNGLLALGDYPAKLVRDEHKTAYQTMQEYELQFPDGKTEKFALVGQSE